MNTRIIMHDPRTHRSAFRAPHSAFERAFTRAELLVLFAVLTLLAFLVLPALANTRPRSHRVICANNLRQIGMGVQLWGNDRGDRPPQEVELAEGGTRRHALAANTWVHFAWLSNEIASPKVLLCPADTGVQATEFTGNPAGGYLHPNFANRATSYALSYRFNSLNPFLAGDRNLVFTGGSAGCSIFNVARAIPLPYSGTTAGWNESIHVLAGNYLSFDGSVKQADNAALRKAFDQAHVDDGASSLHFSVPR